MHDLTMPCFNLKKKSHLKDFFIIGSFLVGAILFFPKIVGSNMVAFGYGGSNVIQVPAPVSTPTLTPTPVVTQTVNSTKQAVPEIKKSSEKQILTFSIPRQIGDTSYDEENHTIDVIMPYGTDVTMLSPSITFRGASINPENGNLQNFINNRIYTVTAEDDSKQSYTVRVLVTSRIPKTEDTDWFNKTADRTDILRDGIIDNLDVVTLFTNWGRTNPANIADVNQDHKVDIIDFNYIMVNWGEIEPSNS